MINFDCRLARADFLFEAAFEAASGVTALFGPSGSGKSTAIRLMAGLERPERGRITVHETTLLDTQRGVFIKPHRRRIGLVFQDALLMPHLSVRANLAYGQFFTPVAERRIGLEPVIEVLGIGHLLDRSPATLSGGERQRVAIGRALLASPRLLLMDEPLASLDAARKLEILPFIERLRDEFRLPVIYVSHSVEEVSRLASHVVRLEAGRVVAAGPSAQVLAPLFLDSDRFEAVSVLSAPVRQHLPDYGVTILGHPAGDIVVPGCIEASGDVPIVVRATNVTLAAGPTPDMSVRTALDGMILDIRTDGGPFVLVSIRLTGGDLLTACITRLGIDALGLKVGDPVRALVKSVTIDRRDVAGHTGG